MRLSAFPLFNGRSPGLELFAARLPGKTSGYIRQCIVHYSRGGGTGISPDSRFTSKMKHRWFGIAFTSFEFK